CFVQAEDGIRAFHVTGVQTCALPIYPDPNMYVPLPARRTEAPHYAYPEHLRAQIGTLPRAPGVYVFHGEDERVPLYIGKSIDIQIGRASCRKSVDRGGGRSQNRQEKA